MLHIVVRSGVALPNTAPLMPVDDDPQHQTGAGHDLVEI